MEASLRTIMARQDFEPYTAIWKVGHTGAGTYRGEITLGSAKLVLSEYTKYADVTYPYKDHYVMEYFMTLPELRLRQFMTALGFDGLTDTRDVYYNLMWYINAAPNAYGTGLSVAEMSYMATLTPAHLQSILGPRYRGPTDKASLLFAAISGKSSDRPDLRTIARYPKVATYPPAVVWELAMQSGIFIEDNTTGVHYVSSYPPYVHVSLQVPTPTEEIMGEVNEANVNQMIQRYGVGLPTLTPYNTPEKALDWFMTNLKTYPDTFIRPPNLPPPPALANMRHTQITEALRFYTNQEIVDAYEPTRTWDNRRTLIRDVSAEAEAKDPKWNWRVGHCNNDETDNVIEGDQHGNIDKNDPENPTISYGVQGNYRCYQLFELAASFREDENGIFHFTVPDWVDDNTLKLLGRTAIDPTTGQPLIREFSVASMKELRTQLARPPAKYAKSPAVTELTTAINNGLAQLANANAAMQRLRNAYLAMTPTQQYLVRVYLAWLFLFGMWMRFWRGAPNPYPVRWVEGGGDYGGKGDVLCTTERRDEHVLLQLSLRSAIIDAYEKDPVLKPIIDDLPLVNYDFNTKEAAIATPNPKAPYRVNDIVEPLQRGKFCEAHGSDLILKSSYYLATKILGLTTDAQLNAYLAEMYPYLKNLEQQVVNYHLEHIKDPTKARERVSMLEVRRNQLQRDDRLPQFDTKNITRTGHTDPDRGWNIQFEKN